MNSEVRSESSVQWEPIATAPRDTWVVVSHRGTQRSSVAKQLVGDLWVSIDHKPLYPSIWRSIPVPP